MGMAPVNNYPKWTGWQAVFVLAAMLVLVWPVALIENFFTMIFIQNLVMGALVIFVSRWSGASLHDLGLHRRDLGRNVLTGFLGGLALAFLIPAVLILMKFLTGHEPELQEVARQLTGAPGGLRMLWPVLVISVAAPVAEELYFRGMVFPLLRARFGVDAAILVSALLFSLLHFSLYGLAPITIGGAVLAYLYHRTGSLVTSVIAHGTWNGITVLLTLYADKFTRYI
jgi:membrane protease YdiL (CAAX protease family)